MAGYVKGQTGLAVQRPGSHELDLQVQAEAIMRPEEYSGRRWWSEIDCGPLFNPYVEWDCVCRPRHGGSCGGPGAIAGTYRPSYRLEDGEDEETDMDAEDEQECECVCVCDSQPPV